MFSHIPIFRDGDALFLDDSWYSDVVLARDFFGELGELHLMGPSAPANPEHSGLVRVHPEDGIHLHPSIRADTRVRAYPAAIRAWRAQARPLVEHATLVHASIDDPFRPMQSLGLRLAFELGKPTVTIGFDMDVWTTLPTQIKAAGLKGKAMLVPRAAIMDLQMRYAVSKASVAMLKEGKVFDRYERFARNPKMFCHSMHWERHLIDDAAFEERMKGVTEGRRLELGYFGRFVERKGLADALRILAEAKRRGVTARYTLTGWGPQKEALERMVIDLGLQQDVVFADPVPYGDALHQRLRQTDLLLFTPTEEDTPRMLYDAFAAGVPGLATRIPFMRYRARSDRSLELFPVGDVSAGAAALVALDRDRARLRALAERARAAGAYHTVERWYGRRLQWTLEALPARPAS